MHEHVSVCVCVCVMHRCVHCIMQSNEQQRSAHSLSVLKAENNGVILG